MSLRATVVLEADPEEVRAWLVDLYDPGEEIPEPDVWFAERVQGLVEDEFAVATMFGPISVSLGAFE